LSSSFSASTDARRHLFRVLGYMRPSDYAFGTGVAVANPAAFYLIEKVSPSHVGRGGFAPGMRLIIGLGLGAGFLVSYSRSYRAFPYAPPIARVAGIGC
jgi:hypothetical protein